MPFKAQWSFFGHHPTKETLKHYAIGDLDGRDTEEVKKHLDQCEDCKLDYTIGHAPDAQEQK